MTYYRPLPQVLTEEELEKIIYSNYPYKSVWTKLKYDNLYRLMAASGLRRSEVCQLRVGDLDFSRQTLIVLKGKGGKPRIVPLPPEVLLPLSQYIGRAVGSDPLFPGIKNQPMNPDTMAHDLRARCKAAGIERRIHPHMFRHTYATSLLRAPQSNLLHVQRLLGHANPQTTSIYTHLITEDLEPTVNSLPYRKLLKGRYYETTNHN